MFSDVSSMQRKTRSKDRRKNEKEIDRARQCGEYVARREYVARTQRKQRRSEVVQRTLRET